ncbi:DUF4112 domain-containing protein [Vacuolonema iberomarrocanum]|uniref:DUF4112 domain-containing protein n=1 Tax=Vacuolonema iberomarrocanum TaxID=3454632 RepID=UPI0019E9C959|nr:DUF4112 domain-containing protein [filamentous cyanobacterium LEGE 07170]
MNTSSRLRNLNRIRRISRFMDTAFKLPLIGIRIGWDPILGLIPGAGDLIATAISAYVIFLAARFRLPNGVLGQMIFNVLLEMVIGAIPLLGDIFDAFYKSNVRNLALLETHLQNQLPDLQMQDRLHLDSVKSGNIVT